MLIFIKLVLGHLIGDFVLQPKKWVLHKQANKITSKYLYLHVLLHFALYMLLSGVNYYGSGFRRYVKSD